MDISTLRLGLAHSALRQALGDEMSPISFAQGSFAFIHRQSGAQFFCCADSSALPIMSILPDGTLGDGSDQPSQEIRAASEPIYLAAWSSFARDFDRASSTEARARGQAASAKGPATQAEPRRSVRAVRFPQEPAIAEPVPTGQALGAPQAPPSRPPTPPPTQAVLPPKEPPIAKPMQAGQALGTPQAAPSPPRPIQPVPMESAPAAKPRSISEHTGTRRALRPGPLNPMADRV